MGAWPPAKAGPVHSAASSRCSSWLYKQSTLQQDIMRSLTVEESHTESRNAFAARIRATTTATAAMTTTKPSDQRITTIWPFRCCAAKRHESSKLHRIKEEWMQRSCNASGLRGCCGGVDGRRPPAFVMQGWCKPSLVFEEL